jgi:hypothetical protein
MAALVDCALVRCLKRALAGGARLVGSASTRV